jgi:hypothetical protein
VGSLAIESSEAVGEIADLVNDLHSEIQNVTQNISKNSDNVKDTVEISKNIELGLKNIEESFKYISKDTFNIVNVTKNSIALMSEFNNAMAVSNDSIQSLDSTIKQVYESVDTLNIKTQQMKSIMTLLNKASNDLSIIKMNSGFDLNDLDKSLIADTVNNTISEIRDKLKQNPFTKDISQVKKYITDEMNNSEDFSAMWVNDTDGNFIFSLPAAGIANANVRDWFHCALEGEIYSSDIYISAISKRPCVTIVFPIYEGNRIEMLLGIDLNIIYE